MTISTDAGVLPKLDAVLLWALICCFWLQMQLVVRYAVESTLSASVSTAYGGVTWVHNNHTHSLLFIHVMKALFFDPHRLWQCGWPMQRSWQLFHLTNGSLRKAWVQLSGHVFLICFKPTVVETTLVWSFIHTTTSGLLVQTGSPFPLMFTSTLRNQASFYFSHWLRWETLPTHMHGATHIVGCPLACSCGQRCKSSHLRNNIGDLNIQDHEFRCQYSGWCQFENPIRRWENELSVE